MPNGAIAFMVAGDPVGKGRPRASRTPKGVRLYTPEKTANYEGKVAYAGHQAMAGREPLQCAVAVGMHIFLTIPASWSMVKQQRALRGEVLPTGKPDIDNVEKAIFDALNGVCWRDDTLVVDVIKSKRYSRTPCVKVEIMPAQEVTE